MSLEFQFNKTFLKELSRIPAAQRIKIEQFIFNDIKSFNKTEDIPKLSKLKGYKNYYKFRFGNYRIGIKIIYNVLIFERILHRKDIYKYYP
jgi:mRNA interferase RelE/StbE